MKGNICYTPGPDNLVIRENAFTVCEDGICRGVFDIIPDRYGGLKVIDCSGMLVIPGLVDLHTHAPQFAFRGSGMDFELLEWLDRVTFPEEMRYADEAYARSAYEIVVARLKQSAVTRVVLFGTIHTSSTLILADLMENSGLISYVGKVNMDRNAPQGLREESASYSAAETRRFVEECISRRYRHTKPIITPRFVISCTDELMRELGRIREEYNLPVQSHLSENPGEVLQVKELETEAAFYGDVYDRAGLFGRGANAVMAHCIYSEPEEVERILENGVWVAHCPESNMNLASGIAPIRRYLEKGIRVGLGTDVAAGTSESMFHAVTDAIKVSKLYWRYVDSDAKPLTFPESFYLATKGGGAFFGKAGSFEDGFDFDAVVLDDRILSFAHPLSVRDRLESAFYQELDQTGIFMKFAAGKQVI